MSGRHPIATSDEAVEALRSLIKQSGGPVALAKQLNITSQAISQWRRVPAERVLHVSSVTGHRPHLLRPDLYPEGLTAWPNADRAAQAHVEGRRS